MKACPNCKYETGKLLTKHEAETLSYMLLGMSRKEIGTLLFKSPKTIATFWYRARKKLGVHDLFSVHRKWITQRMLDTPDMDKSIDFRDGYSQALADALNPDLTIFQGDN